MKKIIKLTESDLTRIVKRIIKEQTEGGILIVSFFLCIKKNYPYLSNIRTFFKTQHIYLNK